MPHGALREILPDVFFVTGTIALPLALPVRFSRNMTVVRDGAPVLADAKSLYRPAIERAAASR